MPKLLLEHLLKRSDFLNVAKAGKRYLTPGFIVQIHPRDPSGSSRYGITATRKIGGAVERNRAKRRLRALIRQILEVTGQPGFDYVFIARKEILRRSFTLMSQDLENALINLHRKVEP